MDYNFIMLADSRFISYAASELEDRLGLDTRPKAMALGRGIYLVRLNSVGDKSLGKLRNATFFYGVVPVREIVKGHIDKDQIREIVSKIVSKGEPFRIELISLGMKRGESAKTTEVAIGKGLEASGFTVSLDSPKRVVYVIMGEGITVVSSVASADMDDITIDHFRLENRDKDKLNRAEVKMREAFRAFGISGEKVRNCIDVGASPGGWTNFLVKRGVKVVAIDKGNLDYSKLATKDFKVVESLEEYIEGHDVLHIKMNLDANEELPFRENDFDLLAIDTNTEFIESSEIANSLSKFVRHGGILIMTLKLPKISDAGKIHMAREALSKEYKVEMIKKLHHNRMELTLFARRL